MWKFCRVLIMYNYMTCRLTVPLAERLNETAQTKTVCNLHSSLRKVSLVNELMCERSSTMTLLQIHCQRWKNVEEQSVFSEVFEDNKIVAPFQTLNGGLVDWIFAWPWSHQFCWSTWTWSRARTNFPPMLVLTSIVLQMQNAAFMFLVTVVSI